jgi:uncharacterized protein
MNTRTPATWPDPTERIAVPMRDGVRLDTYIWRPTAPDRVPAILTRTPYSRTLNRGIEPTLLRYLQAGYAVVMQQIRGIGASEGEFSFNSPLDRSDGHDTVEWIASQAWCTGAVGMDGHSYGGMTQLTTAAARPPHLRCIVPAVPSVDFFLEPPYIGGVFSRMHTLVWGKSLQFDSMLDEERGAFDLNGFLSQPELLARWTSRPLDEAAEGELSGQTRRHYLEVLAHPTRDAWWRERELQAHEFAGMDVPTLVVTGNFDPSTGALTLWRGLETHAEGASTRHLLIGPWDHNQCYVGGNLHRPGYDLPETTGIDVVERRLAFFDQHLKQQGPGAQLPGRVTVFITGANQWHNFDSFPPPAVVQEAFHLHSGGHANSSSGDGRLARMAPSADSPPDHFLDDPEWPFVAAMAGAKGAAHALDMRERERNHDTLVYCTGPLAEPLTLLGEAVAELHVSADAPDADVVVWLVEHRADASSIWLAFGQLRLRYHQGFDAERLLQPGEPVLARIRMTYVGHQIPAGHRLRLLVSGNNFPLLDPNPHTGEPVATARGMRRALQTVFHDAAKPSRLLLPALRATD